MNFFRRRCLHIILLNLSILVSVSLKAVVTRVVVTKTESYLENKKFGNAGSYLILTGQFYGEADPDDPLNSVIQDISLAPVNERGMVEYVSDFVILRPADMEKSNGLLFLSLPNRGNIFPADSVLLSRGYIYLWCAWQGDAVLAGMRL